MIPKKALIAASMAVVVTISVPTARAVPAYARQLNMDCGGCHTRFPQLNAFGRSFKLSGYTLTAQPQIESKDDKDQELLGLPSIPPLGLMFQASYTSVAKSVPDAQNNDFEFPQEMSLFLAGRLSPKLGTFLQATYDGNDDNFSIDNTEFRFADNTTLAGKELQYGFTLNNNPTVEDLWNSTPVWGFPWASPDVAPTPPTSALIEGNLGQMVAGLGGYAMWDGQIYGAFTLYRSAELGNGGPPNSDSEDTLESTAPYWRLAWQHGWGANYLELGTYGIYAKLYPEGITGSKDKYTDVAGDFQYERMFGDNQLTVHGSYIYEKRRLNGSVADGLAEDTSNHLDVFHLDAGYILGQWQLIGGYFGIKGGHDALLYGPDAENGGVDGVPDSDGFILQAAYFPWKNVELQGQYTMYTKFDGESNNYDLSGRDASDNNTLYVLAWFVW